MTYQWGYSPAMTRANAMLAVAWSDGKDESHSQCCVPYGQKSPCPFPCRGRWRLLASLVTRVTVPESMIASSANRPVSASLGSLFREPNKINSCSLRTCGNERPEVRNLICGVGAAWIDTDGLRSIRIICDRQSRCSAKRRKPISILRLEAQRTGKNCLLVFPKVTDTTTEFRDAADWLSFLRWMRSE